MENRATSRVGVATASLIGTAIEWYDLQQDFPTFDPMVGTLLSFARNAPKPVHWCTEKCTTAPPPAIEASTAAERGR